MLFFLCENLLSDSNAILKRAYKDRLIQFYVSGSSSQYINGSRQLTKPEYAFDQIDKQYDWCSNCGKHKEDHPWIIFNLNNNKMFEINGYYIKSGCCSGTDGCCCYDEVHYCCECCLFSWSLQISNDNSTWKTVHKVERDYEMRRCRDKTYKFTETHRAKFIRLIQDEACYDDPPCIAINKIDFIGQIFEDGAPLNDYNIDNEDEDVSIIGHISKNKY